MSNDLVSRKLLLKELDELIAQYSYERDGAVLMDVLTCVRDMVFDMPTAYDTDRVIEQLDNEAANNTEFFTDDYRDDYYRGAYAAYCEAIEIVKGGGAE